MRIVRRDLSAAESLAVFSGSFHPPTRAHTGVARAALAVVDEVLFVLPRRFPHKTYGGVDLEDRLRLLESATAGERRFSVGVGDGGLFIETARECREVYGPGVSLWLLCGRDAAERTVNWDYGEAEPFGRQLEEYGLLVADREGRYAPPAEYAHRIRRLDVEEDYSETSATAVREAIQVGRPWEHMVPEAIVAEVGELYGRLGCRAPGRSVRPGAEELVPPESQEE